MSTKSKIKDIYPISIFIVFIAVVLILFVFISHREAKKHKINYSDIEVFYKNLIKTSPQEIRHYVALAGVYEKQGYTNLAFDIKENGIAAIKNKINNNNIYGENEKNVYYSPYIYKYRYNIPVYDISLNENIFNSSASSNYSSYYKDIKNYLENANYEETVKRNNLHDKSKSKEENISVTLLFGDKYRALGKYEEALDEYMKALEMHEGENSQISGKIAYINYLEKKYYEAEKYYKKSLMSDKTNVYIKFNLAKTYINLGKTKEAITMFSDIVASENDIDEDILYKSLVESAYIYFVQSKYMEALAVYLKALNIKTDEYILMEIGFTYEMLKNKPMAKSYFIKSIGIAESFDAYYNLGRLEYENAYYEKASEYFKKALDIDKKHTEGYVMLGTTLMLLGDNERAKTLFENALEYKSEDPYIYSKMAYIYINENNFEKAFDMINKSIEYGDRSSNNYILLADLYTASGKVPEAIAAYEKAISIDDKNVSIRYNLGCLYINNFEYEKALRMFEYVINEMPAFDDAYRKTAYIYSAVYGDNETARKYMERRNSVINKN